MDLDRLKISPDKAGKKATQGGRKSVVPVVALLCFGLGFAAAALIGPCRKEDGLKVETVVVRSRDTQGSKSFSAGGWIEVAVPDYPVTINSRISERVTKLHVKEGTDVEPGQLLATLYAADIKLQLDLAEAKLEAARQELAKSKTGYRAEDVTVASASADVSAERLRLAEANYMRSKGLEAGVLSKEELDRELAAYNESRATHAAKKAELEKMRSGYRKEDIAVAGAKVSEAEAVVRLAERKLGYCMVRAADDSPVLRVLKVKRRVGDWVDADKDGALLTLYDPVNMQARVDVTQANVRYVKTGGKVLITTEARPGQKYHGTVLRIDPLAELAKNTVTVRIRIDDPDDVLFPEMVTHVNFLAAASPGGSKQVGRVLALPESAVVEETGSHYVFVENGNFASKEEVTIKERKSGKVFVSGGLSSGQRVIVNNVDKLLDGMKIEVQ